VADEHKVELETLYKLFESSPGGLTSREAKRRLQEYGTN